MPRIRTIKPEFPQSESMGRVSRDARLLFIQIWTLCDDSGRTRAASRMLASLLFPYDDDAPSLIDDWLEELEREGCITRHQLECGTYLQVCNWLTHQKIDKPSVSKIPPLDESSRILANPRERSLLDQGSRTKDQGRDQGLGEDQGTQSPTAPSLPALCEKPHKPARKKPEAAPTAEVWAAYSTAYALRYAVEPVRNAKGNGMLAKLLHRIPAADAPHVAASYVASNSALYVRARHCIDLLLRDAEALHTDWRRGVGVTHHEATALDRTQTNYNAFEPLLREARQREALHGVQAIDLPKVAAPTH